MQVQPFSVEKIKIPTSFCEFGKSEEGVNVAGCENCAVSQKALKALKSPQASWLRDHWESQDKTLREKLGKVHGVDSQNIFLTSGAIAGIDYAFRIFVNEKTNVGLISPDFPGFKHYAERGKAHKEVLAMMEFPFTVSAEQITNFVRKKSIDLMILSNPNAITGTYHKKKEIEKMIKENQRTLFIIDEADSIRPESQAPHLTEVYDNVLFLGSFSKFYGLSGLRIGYLIAPQLYKQHCEDTINPAELTSLAIIAATASLEDKAYQKATQERVRINQSILEKACMGTLYQIVPGSTCFATYLWADKSVEDPAKTLAQRGIAIAHGYGQIARGGRINVADTEKVRKVAKAIKEIFQK